MDAEEFLYRALGVPGIVRSANRREVAAARLREAAGIRPALGVGPPPSGGLQALTVAVLEAVTIALTEGVLDLLLGAVEGADLTDATGCVLGRVKRPDDVSGHLADHGEPLVTAAVKRLPAFASARPDLGWSQP